MQTIQLTLSVDGQVVDHAAIKPGSLPPYLGAGASLQLQPPSVTELVHLFEAEARQNNSILAIFHSRHLSALVNNAQQAAKEIMGRATIMIVDSLSIGPGLGMMVQAAAEAMTHGALITDAERIVRTMQSHIYTVLCTPNLTYLHNCGVIDHAQATVGEMLNLQSIFALEDGQLTTLQKERNHRQVLDFFQEYLDEFEELKHIALLLGTSTHSSESRFLRDHALIAFARVPFSEHAINLSLAAMLGPETTGLFLLDK